jgi:LPXTG-motif cell wall-anchored protein
MSIHHDKIIASTLGNVRPGDRVCTADNEELGKVLEVSDTAIKVAEPLHAAYWIAGDHVLRAEDGKVALSFIRNDIGAYRMNAPHAQAADPLVEQESDRAITEREQAETRVRMERELAGQRESLPHMHPGDDRPPDTFGTFGEPVEDELARTTGRRPSARDEETVVTGGIGNLAPLLAGLALLGVVGAGAAWRRRRRRSQV